jgi:hypothetical protein
MNVCATVYLDHLLVLKNYLPKTTAKQSYFRYTSYETNFAYSSVAGFRVKIGIIYIFNYIYNIYQNIFIVD